MFYQVTQPPTIATTVISENTSAPESSNFGRESPAMEVDSTSVIPSINLNISQSTISQSDLELKEVEHKSIVERIHTAKSAAKDSKDNLIDKLKRLQVVQKNNTDLLALQEKTTKKSPDWEDVRAKLRQKLDHNSFNSETPKISIPKVEKLKTEVTKIDSKTDSKLDNISVIEGIETASTGTNNLLLGVVINKRDVGTLDVAREEDTLLLPLLEFAKLAKFSVEKINGITELNTPLGKIKLAENEIKTINETDYISDKVLKEKLLANIELNNFDFALIIDLPWGEGSQRRPELVQLKPEFFPALSGISSYRQELSITTGSGDNNFRSSSLLGGRLGGGLWRVRLNNNFINSPDISEYFYYKNNGQFSYQVGRQQIGLHPLLNNVNLTGAQFAFTNLPKDRFNETYSASELLPRRSRPIQTFQGTVAPASFVQLRVGGIAIAQQQVGLDGKYEFLDINLPTGQSNEIELFVFDRNNPNVATEIRSLRLNSSDLLLPSGGQVQLGGLGLTGNLAQNTLFNDFNSSEAGKLTAFYQLRQGLSENLTFEGGVQTLPDTVQTQAGLIWRLANPLIVSASVGSSRGELGYTTDLDLQLKRLQIIGNSQLFPNGYSNPSSRAARDRYNHSLEVKYKFANAFNLGFIARSRQDSSRSADYILPTFSFRPMRGMFLSGRPDFEGNYLFNAFYQINSASRLAFNSSNNRYFSDFSYNLNRQYQLSFGSEFGGDFGTRYSATLNRNALNLSGLSWRLGLAYSDGDVAPIVGASMQVLPGLLARIDYQGIPSRSRNGLGGFGDDRLSISLVSDLSFAGGKITPVSSNSFGKQKGAIAGRIVVEGAENGFNLGNAIVRVINNRGKNLGGARTDASGNFFVGNLPEGIYTVELDPEKLPIELTVSKGSVVAEVASSAVTRLDFTARAEYGMAGRVTDTIGTPVANLRLDLINTEGKRVLAAWTDEFGLYRLDGVPIGKYTLLIPPQVPVNSNEELPKIQVEIRNQFVYEQNLQLPVVISYDKPFPGDTSPKGQNSK
ncbi:hypothetical protein NIES4101_31290 [Calothrix sp. NIES-4101]|nr:hypothetical protein NIES4101_31290 [Calothrix sp. NIES-4101]